jgi:hypothetical protein
LDGTEPPNLLEASGVPYWLEGSLPNRLNALEALYWLDCVKPPNRPDVVRVPPNAADVTETESSSSNRESSSWFEGMGCWPDVAGRYWRSG